MRQLSCLLSASLAMIAVVHFYWAAGGRTARAAASPSLNQTPVFRAGPLACVAVGLLLLTAAFLILGRGGVLTLPVPRILMIVGTWGVGVVFALRAMGDFRYFGFFRRVTGTAFARNDALFYTPLVLLLAIGTFIVSWKAD
jgi:hypothetical protein